MSFDTFIKSKIDSFSNDMKKNQIKIVELYFQIANEFIANVERTIKLTKERKDAKLRDQVQ